MFFGLVLVGLAVGAFSGWCLGRALQNILAPWLGNNPIVVLAPAALAILLAWLFAVLPWFIPGWRRYTELERQRFIRSAILFPAKVAIPAGAVLGGNLVGGIGLAVAFSVLFLVLTRWIIRTPAYRKST
ncbi:MAG: hypothetical protein U1E05_05695 [Patescibacteria group bacterium]|nr:hypothetical protein [Patescibacteria group bacterium]